MDELTLFEPALLDSSRVPGGGRSAHHWIIAISWQVYYFFYVAVLVLDVKGQKLKTHPSKLKTVALRLFWKILVFGKNQIFLNVHYLDTKLFIEK